MHQPIQLQNLSLSFPNKTCFEDFSPQINYGQRIAIIGRNGSGKSSLLKILQDNLSNIKVGYVPQVITEFDSLSGGERLNKSFTEALKLDPDVLLLDEPSNHLDSHNRHSLMRMLKSYPGTLIIVSHDIELLRNHIDIIWHIDNAKIHIFSGNYADYMYEIHLKRSSIEKTLLQLNRQKKDTHQALMKEQERAAKSKNKGKKSISQRKWPSVVSKAKALRAEETTGKKKTAIDNKKHELNSQLSDLRLPEIIKPHFSLTSADILNKTLVSINEASLRYSNNDPILQDINLSIGSKDKIALVGKNASGKSSLIKAILNDINIIKDGTWHMPNIKDIGYLDQHYETLSPNLSVLETIEEIAPSWSHAETRSHLNDFLFRKNEEINSLTSNLSGGERARLCLAQIAAKTPKLLILDEVTNNLDLETREHLIEILKEYPAAIIIISHDEDFIREIYISDIYEIKDKTLKLQS